jgi:hypothetical protein
LVPEDECQQNYLGKSAPEHSAQLSPTGSGPAHVVLGENVTLASLNVEAGGSLSGGSVTATRSLGWTGGSIASKINMSAGSVGHIDGPDTKQFNGLFNNCGYGELVGDATLAGGGRFDWTGGTVGENASLTIAEGSSMRLTGPAAKELQGDVIKRGKAFYLSMAVPVPATGPLVFVGDAGFLNV